MFNRMEMILQAHEFPPALGTQKSHIEITHHNRYRTAHVDDTGNLTMDSWRLTCYHTTGNLNRRQNSVVETHRDEDNFWKSGS